MYLYHRIFTYIRLILIIFTARNPLEDCPKWRDPSESLEEQCTLQAACLRVGAIYSYLDAIYINERMDNNEVLGLFCTKMGEFDNAIKESLDYLDEMGCTEERAMLDKETGRNVTKSYREFWTLSRSFLQSIHTVVCARSQNEVCPNDDLLPHIYDFTKCFNDHLTGSWDMFPASSFNRRHVCEFTYQLKRCTDVHAITEPCDGTSQAQSVIDLNEKFAEIAEVNDCESLRLH